MRGGFVTKSFCGSNYTDDLILDVGNTDLEFNPEHLETKVSQTNVSGMVKSVA